MQKAKKYDWKDSNMALFGSETEKEVRYFEKYFGSTTLELRPVISETNKKVNKTPSSMFYVFTLLLFRSQELLIVVRS